jgi:hypothetical protein
MTYDYGWYNWMNMIGPTDEEQEWWLDEILEWESIFESADLIWSKEEAQREAFGPTMLGSVSDAGYP